ncbi:hypothetical protein HanXRQr2_Chr16g0749591 [Helianthus annuus]|uniref:Uncharacterized protein n=1 Tax=Helianthus annuus TaxID=4232 RepID=A0A9K3GYS1_HELAN|nr:hypothetical protein HanXRQr2_Chr16g0749591 [Helianthus annuus]KAJ0438218.1 hypothetical protein HanHA300_Chr16g0611411 [Helianthus annuus]KAJ0460543.1 hypothetical protein HanHA89_Chr16g0662001 [Helianthus annuus]
MTLPQFAVATGFYTQQEVHEPGFVTLLRGVVKKAQDFCVMKEDLARFWGTIATAPFSNNMVASDIRDPVHRFIHKILAATLIGRHEGDNKVNHHSLFCLMCMVEGQPANLASIFAWSMTRPSRGGRQARLYCGPYITWLAESLAVFADYPAERMHTGPAPTLMELKSFQSAGIVTYDEPPAWAAIVKGPQVQPPPSTVAAEAMQATIPPRYQVPLVRCELPARQYPIREPRPDPLTLKAVYDRVKGLYDYVDDQFGQMRHQMETCQRRLEDGMRVLMDHFQLQPPPSWEAGFEEQWNEGERDDEG